MTATTTSIGTTDVIELAFIPRNNSNNVSVADLENNPPPDVQEQPPAASTAAEEIQTPLTFLVAAKLTSACFAFFVAGTNDGSLGALIPYMIRGYRIGTGSVSILYACSFVGWVTAAMVGGYARAYFGSGGVLVLGAVMQLLAQALRIWEPPFALFLVTFSLIALGQAFQDSQANTFVSTVKSAHRWLGAVHASYSVGCLTGPLVATSIALARPERWVLFYCVPLGMGIINIMIVSWSFRHDISIFKVKTSSCEEPEAGGRGRQAWQEMKGTVKEKTVWLLSLFFFFYLGVGFTVGGWLVEYLVTVRKDRLSTAGYIPTAYYGGITLGRLLLPEITHRFGEKRMVLLYSFLCLSLQVAFWKVDNLVANGVFVTCMGFLLGPYFATGISVATKLLPRKIHASALGLIFVVAQAGGSLFPTITGVIADKAGVGTLQPVLIGLIVAMGLSWSLVPSIVKKNE